MGAVRRHDVCHEQGFSESGSLVVPALFWLSGIMYDANSITQPVIRKILLFNRLPSLPTVIGTALSINSGSESSVEFRNYCIVLVIMILLAVWAYKRLKKDIPMYCRK